MADKASPDTSTPPIKRAHKTRYTMEDRLRAVSVVASMGEGVTPASLAQVNKIMRKEININTLKQWQRELKPLILATNPELQPVEIDTAKIVAEVREKLLRNLSSTIEKVSDRQNEDSVINAASLRDLSVTLGISVEKLLLVAGHNTHASELFKQLETECNGTEYNAIQLLEDLIKAIHLRKQSRIELEIENNKLISSQSATTDNVDYRKE